MIEVELNKIRIDERRGEQLIVLKEKNGERVLPIVIGIMEVTSIKMKLSGIEPPRPLTHDLLAQVIAGLGAETERIVIHKLESNTFFARIILKSRDGTLTEVDARPSDSIALATRCETPIYVEEEVFENVASGFGDL